MKGWAIWLLAGVMLMLTVVGLGWWLQAGESQSVKAVVNVPAQELPALSASQAPVLPASGAVAPAVVAHSDAPLLPLPAQQVDAVVSMSAARVKGDPSAPPVMHESQGEVATAAELADPKAYQRYESRQNQRVYDAYIKAAATEIPRLQDDIARARREGIPEDEIRKGEEKLRRIQAMRDQLQADHPQPAGAAAAP